MQELARGVITIELNLDNLLSFTMIKITQNVFLFQQHLPAAKPKVFEFSRRLVFLLLCQKATKHGRVPLL